MKKLSLFVLILSLIISLLYSYNLHFNAKDIGDYIRLTLSTLVSEIGLFFAYYYARDLEIIRSHERRQAEAIAHFEEMQNKFSQPTPKD